MDVRRHESEAWDSEVAPGALLGSCEDSNPEEVLSLLGD